MSLLNRIKVKVMAKRGATPAAPQEQPPKIEVREKSGYQCASCHNQYYDHHIYCPQCLGEVRPAHPHPSQLRLLSVPAGKKLELAQLLAALSDRKEFPFQKALDSLPWVMIGKTEECVLRHWKDVLTAEAAESEIAAFDPAARKRWLGRDPLFAENAPPPRFLSAAADAGARQVARSIEDPTLRMRWVECALIGIRLMDDFYKHHPSERVVFSEFLFHIDQEFVEAARDYESIYKKRQGNLVERIDGIRARFESMQQEILEIRRSVEDRL